MSDQASLPSISGGLGIKKIEDIAVPAYLPASTLKLSSEIWTKFNFHMIDSNIF